MVRLISRQRGGLAALKLSKLFGIDDFPAAKDSGKVLIIIIYCYLIIIFLIFSICSGSRQPTSNARTQNYGAEGNVGHANPAYDQTNIEPEYMEIDGFQRPEQQPDVGFRNPHFDPGDHYQSLGKANGRPDNVYGRLDKTSEHSQSEA